MHCLALPTARILHDEPQVATSSYGRPPRAGPGWLHNRRPAGRMIRKMSSRRRTVLSLPTAVLAAGLLAGCQASSASRDAGRDRAAETREVQVVPATEERLVRAIAVTGTLAAEEQVTLS